MKYCFIVEKATVQEDWAESYSKATEFANSGEEVDIVYEVSYGEYEYLLKVRMEVNKTTSKFEPRYWYNQSLIQKLHIQNVGWEF